MAKEMFTMQERGVPDPLIEEVVKWCNSLLVEDGKDPITELPPGAPDDVESCPCGLVTGWVHYTTYACRYDHDKPFVRKVLPEAVQEAIKIFDQSEEDEEYFDE